MAETPNQALVGREGPPATIHVDRARVRQFARSVGITDPACYDAAEAKRRGYPGLLAPPTLPIALGQDAEPRAGQMPRIQWDVRKRLHEATTIEDERPIFSGAVLAMKGMLKSLTPPEGERGARTIYILDCALY